MYIPHCVHYVSAFGLNGWWRTRVNLQAEEALEDSPVVDDGPADTSGSLDDGISSSAAGVSEATPAEMSADSTPGGGGGGSGNGGEAADSRITGTEAGAGTLAPGEGPPSFLEARRLFELGILADPAHGPLYNAYG